MKQKLDKKRNLKEQTPKKRGKKELPVTGILAGVVVILLGILIVLIFGLRSQERMDKKQKEARRETDFSEKERTENSERESSSRRTETERISENKETENSSEAGKLEQSASEVFETAENMSPSESGLEQKMMSEAERESETESESETEPPLTVAIDPGHQGSWVDMSEKEPSAPGSSEMKAKATTGTQGSYSGKAEYELNLEISLLLRDELEKRGYRVVLTREDNDTAISNAERALLAYEEGGDIYVRIHANGSEDPSVSGALAMVPSPANPYVGDLAEDSYLLGESILNAYCEKASFSSLGVQYYDNMTGINWSKLPVMILEMGFMTNQSDDLRMADASVQKLMAEGIADGIDAYFERR